MAAIALFFSSFTQWASELQHWRRTNFLSLVEEYGVSPNKHIIWYQESTFKENHEKLGPPALVYTAEQSRSAQTDLLDR